MDDSGWKVRKIARRNFELMIGMYSLGVFMINVAYDDEGVSTVQHFVLSPFAA
jgi:hypothetical protein